MRYSPDAQTLVEDFPQYLRHERGNEIIEVKSFDALFMEFCHT